MRRSLRSMFGVIVYLPGCSAPFRPTTGRSALPFSAHPRPSSAQPFAHDADQIDELVEHQRKAANSKKSSADTCRRIAS
jgi:hypothetical protein